MPVRKNNLYVFLCSFALLLAADWSCSPNEQPAQLQVSSNVVELDGEGERVEIFITSNTPWVLQSPTEWLLISPVSGNGNQLISIEANANDQVENRHATIRIIADNLSEEIQVTQAAGMVLPDYHVPADQTHMRDITSLALAQDMGLGWNLGNSLDAIGGETAWGNPPVTKALIDAVKAAGFKSVRIPVAWSRFVDESEYTIDPAWMDRVEEVVQYVLNNDMYAIVNIHWDGGWMQPTYAEEENVNARLRAMWLQIALRFRDYDDYLLFAGTNEVMVEGDYGTPKPAYVEVQNGFNQTFVDIVRSTGGRNAYRHLVIQSFNTHIDHAVSFAKMPHDETPDRLMMEVHYYDPFDFALNENSPVSQWGEIATDDSKTAGWGGEAYADQQFQKMKSHFVDQGIPVIVGEYGAISKTDIAGHGTFRGYYLEKITQSIVNHDLVPFYWDNGFTGNHGFGLFNRHTGEQAFPELIQKITSSIH